MYTSYFKLSEPPFSLTPDPRYLFMSERHREGLAHLLYGVQRADGFVQLTGDIGSGKTTLCRCLIKQLPSDTDVALILNPRLTAIELLATVCDELRIPYPAENESIKVLIDDLNQRLLETHAQGRRTVLIIDEAQNLDSDVLEQIRLLTNLETSQEKLLQIILIGQPELLSLLKGAKLRQLSQRITARYHLLALSRRETYAYIQHRLFVAGRRDPLFTGPAMRCVYRLSRGVPRVINVICDRALLGAYAFNRRKISASIVRRASREARGLSPGYRRRRFAWMVGIAMLAAVTVGGAILLGPANRSLLRRNGASVTSTAASTLTPESNVSAPAAVPHPMSGTASDGISTGSQLVEILADPSIPSDTVSSFTSLYALWGVKLSLGPSDLACDAGSAEGLECLYQVGGWPKLRRFDLPAILEVMSPSGEWHHVTLVELGNETATLQIGNQLHTFPLWEIDRVWDGSFVLLWKPPFASRKLSRGMHGEEVKWVRRTLDRLEGKAPSPAVSSLYDENLQQRVMAFQRERSLIPDGNVGGETLARLTLALEGPNAPSLSRHNH